MAHKSPAAAPDAVTRRNNPDARRSSSRPPGLAARSTAPRGHREAQADRPEGPDGKPLPGGDHRKGTGLDEQPSGDQTLAADSIGERARAHLAHAQDAG